MNGKKKTPKYVYWKILLLLYFFSQLCTVASDNI